MIPTDREKLAMKTEMAVRGKKEPIKKFDELMEPLRRYNVTNAFTLLLLSARSKRHLRGLHDTLPPNRRLLHKDVQRLIIAWGIVYSVGKRISSTTVHLLFERALGATSTNGSLTRYYRDELYRHRKMIESEYSNEWGDRTITSREKGEHSYPIDFTTILFDATFSLRLSVNDKTGHLIVDIFIPTDQLTEPLTHQLLTNIPISWCGKNSDNELGITTRFNFVLLTDHWIELTKNESRTVRYADRRYTALVATTDLITRVENELRAMGVPIGDIRPASVNQPT